MKWKPVTRDRRYRVSNHGLVSGPSGRVLKPGRSKSGHVTVALGRGKSIGVHVLVMEEFGPEKPFPKAEVRHRDGDPAHNLWTNLIWGSRGDNNRDKKHHAGQKGRLKADEVAEVKRRLARGETGRDLAVWFGVSDSAISAIKCGHNHGEIA